MTTNILISVFGFLITLLMSLVTYIFNKQGQDMKEDMGDLKTTMKEDTQELKRQMTINGRHLDSLSQSVWNVNWRTNGIEDWLEDTSKDQPNKFRSPRIIGQAETREKE